MQEKPGFFAEPGNWVVMAFFLFFIIFGKKLWGRWPACWMRAPPRCGRKWTRPPG